MAISEYLDFELIIEKVPEGYRARVLNSPTGQAEESFSAPFSELELENFYLRMGRSKSGVRRIDSPDLDTAKNIGRKLFDAVFRDDIKTAYFSSLNEARDENKGLRILLRVNAPDLINYPWEYLYNERKNRFLSLAVETPIVRYLELGIKEEVLTVLSPLKILTVISSPQDYPPLDVEREWSNLQSALSELESSGLIELHRVEPATLISLQDHLRRGEYHVFHFIGHGGFDVATEDGVLLFEDDEQRGRLVSGQDLGLLLHNHSTLRLAILNSCDGARTSQNDPFAGVAQNLIQQEVPAVIAMQFEITDQAAITFSKEFYQAISDDYPVGAALTEARTAIKMSGNELEWGTPVLFSRSPEGQLFKLEHTSRQEILQKEEVPSLQKARERIPLWGWITAGSMIFLLIAAAFMLISQLSDPPEQPSPTLTVTAIADTGLEEGAIVFGILPSPSPRHTSTPTETNTPTVDSPPPSPTLMPSKTASTKGTPEIGAYQPVQRGTPLPEGLPVISADNAAKLQEIARWDLEESIYSLTISPDDDQIVAGLFDQILFLDALTGDSLGKPTNTESIIGYLEYAGNNDFLISFEAFRGSNTNPQLWQVEDMTPIMKFDEGEEITSITVGPDGEYCAIGWKEWAINIWFCTNPLGQNWFSDSIPRESWITALAFSEDGKSLASGEAFSTEPPPDNPKMPKGDGAVRLWNWNTENLTGGYNVYDMEQTVRSLAFSPDGEYLAAGYETGDIVLLEVSKLSLANTVPVHFFKIDSGSLSPVYEITFSKNGDLLVAGNRQGYIYIWNINDFNQVTSFEHEGEIWGIKFSHDGTRLITASGDQTIRIWGVLP
jgi:WD40 repeat protein